MSQKARIDGALLILKVMRLHHAYIINPKATCIIMRLIMKHYFKYLQMANGSIMNETRV